MTGWRSCVGRGWPGAPLPPLQGPPGYRRGAPVRFANNLTGKIPILTCTGVYIDPRSSLFWRWGAAVRGEPVWGGPGRPCGPCRTRRGVHGGPGAIRQQFYRENPDTDAQRAYINTRSAFLTTGCSCVGRAGLGRSTAPLRALQDPQGCAWGPGFDSSTHFTELAVFA